MRLPLTVFALSVAAAAQAREPAPLTAYSEAAGFSDFAISPDGHHVAFVVGSENERQIEILAEGDSPPSFVDAKNVKTRSLAWLDSSHLLISVYQTIEQQPILARQTITQGLSYNIETGKSVALLRNTFGSAPVMMGGYASRGQFQGHPVVYMKGFAPGPTFGLYRVDLDTGQGTLIDQGTLASSRWVVTPQGKIVAKAELDRDHRVTSYQIHGASGWKSVPADSLGKDLDFIRLGRSEHTLAFKRGDDLIEVDADNGQVSASLISDGVSSLGRFSADTTGLLTGTRITADSPTYVFFDENWRAGWEKVLGTFPGARVQLKDASDNGRQFVVLVEHFKGAGSGSYYYVDLDRNQAELLREARSGLSADQVGDTTAIDFRAADGLALRGFLTRPPGGADKDLPLILLVHGGPAERVGFDFDVTTQAFASRGYAVFKINYRGSSGVTEALRLAGDGEWGKRMQSDLSDGVVRLVADGIVDPKRVCIFGGGYGGYAALEGVRSQPNTFRCAVAVNPIVDLYSVTREPPYELYGPRWDSVRAIKRYLGATANSAAKMAEISPLKHADAITQPVLLIETSKSDGVPGAEDMFNAVKKTDHSAEFLRATEGDQLNFEARSQHLLAAELAFF